MKFEFFEIRNFRGIQHVRLDLSASPTSNVITLVGLNESGKTTILEAINTITYNKELAAIGIQGYSTEDAHSLIPKAQIANFSGAVSITASILPEEDDCNKIKQFLLSNFDLILESRFESFTITRKIVFEDSKHVPKKSTNVWSFSVLVRKRTSKKVRRLEGEQWLRTVQFIITLLPGILYFPNFLFEFPDRIYLENVEQDNEKHSFYRQVIQDILDSLGNKTNVQTHLLARIQSADPNDKKNVDRLLLEMGRNLTTTIFGAWDRIFHQKRGEKKITINHDRDTDGKAYLQFKIEDNDGYYSINERSVGFRWFFVFLLLTQYRGFRKTKTVNTLFLFDEPASNLHPAAQAQLLQSFETITQNCKIIYTTHSHHLVNPNWLENAYIVKNEGLDYDLDVMQSTFRTTEITLTRYRNFVSQHPDKTSYYKPILDVLDYYPSRLECVPNVLMVEGKTDYFVLNYMGRVVLEQEKNVNVLPGMGAGQLGTVIRLYIAWGLEFIVLLDSDKAGKKEKARYENMFSAAISNRIFTLEDIDPCWKHCCIETLFEPVDKLLIQHKTFPDDREFNKERFHRALQQLLACHQKIVLSEKTVENFAKVLAFVSNKIVRNKL